MSISVDTLIHAGWIIPVLPNAPQTVYRDHSLAIRDGKIVDILPHAEAKAQYQAHHVLNKLQHALIPGLINAHAHAAMNLFRGLADDLPVLEWLQDHIWPAEQRFVNAEFVAQGTLHAAAEMIRGGITCFNDMYFYVEDTAATITKTGMRANVSFPMFDFPTPGGLGPDDYFAKAADAYDSDLTTRYPRINFGFAPHAPYTVSWPLLEKTQHIAQERNWQIQMHIHESQQEVDDFVAKHGERPFTFLSKKGFLTPHLQAVHMCYLNDEEIMLAAKAGTHIVHCPESNLKLASGYARLEDWLSAGINVALGTDGAASNNDLDMFSEMRTAAILAKAHKRDASVAKAHQILKMATYNGAKALGIADKTGSLEVNKEADITAVDLGTIEAKPVYNPISQLVYSTNRTQVTDVWVGGQALLIDRKLTTINESDVLNMVDNWQHKIAENKQ